MSAARLLELINREAAGSERQIVVIVNGEDPITIDAARSINLPIEGDGVFLWIGRKAKPGVLALPEELKEVVERVSLGDTEAPTSDETTYDAGSLTNAILSHIDLLPDAPAPMNEAEAAIIDAMNATQARLDQVEAELKAAGVDPKTLDDDVATIGRAFINGDFDNEATNIHGHGPDETPATTRPDLTKEGLEAMSFQELREIGYGLNVKGTSKAELVRDILAAITPEA